ncbi:MAG: tetratricopeptide repeat protein [Bacteroidota bacterium]
MSLSNALKELLDRYLEGDLTTEERAAFEAQAKENPDLDREIKLHRMVQSTLSNAAERKLRDNLQRIREERHAPPQQETKVRTLTPRRWLNIAATLLLFALGAWWLFQPGANSPELIAQEILQDDRLDRTELSADRSLVQDGIKAYNRGDFAQAAQLFKEYDQQTNPPDWEVRVFLGKALLQQKSYNEAKDFLSSVETSGSLYETEAKWWLAILDLQQQKPKQAKNRLQEVANNKRSDYAEQAQQILRELQ